MAVNPALASNLSTASILGGGTIPPSGIVPPGPIPSPQPAPGAPPMSVPGPASSPFTAPQSFQDKNMAAAALLQGGQQSAPVPPGYSLKGPQPDGTWLMVEQHPDGSESVAKIITPPKSKVAK